MRAVAVAAADTARWKDALAWHFDSFCADGALAPSDLWGDVEAKQRQLWVLEDDDGPCMAALTRVADDRLQSCEVTHAAGRGRERWQHLFPALQSWAREIGCKRIVAIARPGWERLLPLKKTHVILEARL